MEYTPPLNALPGDEEDENRSYWDADPAGDSVALRQGAFPPSTPFEAVQREIVNVIDEAGLTPNGEDLTQLHQAIEAIIAASITGVKEECYPIGTIYKNDSDSRNPSVILGFGTWVAIEDAMIIGASATYPAGSEGGSATTTQTESTLVGHDHEIGWGSGSGSGGNERLTSGFSNSYSTSETGGGNAMNTISPYRAAYTWRRTA